MLNRFRKPARGKDNAYQADAETMYDLQKIAAETGVAILVVHHNRKSGADGGDPFEMVSGTMGLTGGSDTVLVLRREAGIISLYGRGRDHDEDLELGMALDRETARWSILGQAADVKRTDERKAILDVLGASSEPMKPSEIADALEKDGSAIRKLLFRMLRENTPPIRKVGAGYTIAGKVVAPDYASGAAETPDQTRFCSSRKPPGGTLFVPQPQGNRERTCTLEVRAGRFWRAPTRLTIQMAGTAGTKPPKQRQPLDTHQ